MKASVAYFRRAGRGLLAAAAAFLVVLAGCGEPAAMYQVPGAASQVARGQTILVAPFMDTRTFVDEDDTHRDDIGEHARVIFADALRSHTAGADAVVLTPEMPPQERSLANAEAAELGRLHGADVVVTGQVFSFTDTRAASIPARAGMFVRVVSAADGALLFVGDDYQAAAVPGAGGGRDLQARNVAERLVAGLLKDEAATEATEEDTAQAQIQIRAGSSGTAWASLFDGFGEYGEDDEDDEEFDEPLPDVPVITSAPEDFYELPPAKAEAPAPVKSAEEVKIAQSAEDATAPAGDAWTEMAALARLADAVLLEETGKQTVAAQVGKDIEEGAKTKDIADATVADVALPAQAPAALDGWAEEAVDGGLAEIDEEGADTEIANAEIEAEFDAELDAESGADATSRLFAESESLLDASFAARLTGDQLASDLFASDGNLWGDAALPALPALPDFPSAESEVLSGTAGTEWTTTEAEVEPDTETEVAVAETESETEEGLELADSDAEFYDDIELAETADADAEFETADGDAEAASDLALIPEPDGPLYSIPLVAEQPRTYRLDAALAAPAEIAANPGDATIDFDTEVTRAQQSADPGAIRVLILPYHERENEHNLIERTGGGEVVTALYGTQLAADPGLQILWDATGQATHDVLIDRGEAIRMGRMVGADYVVRGQVVEFRRSQSVPSFYSAVISTAVLAAQVFFAEFSGVDVATEVYRVSDGACVMSRRDRSQQKYVVQAEKTVRRLAAGMAESVGAAIRAREPELMTPLIDDLAPVTVLTNPG